MKKCIKCNIEKDTSEFYAAKVNKDGFCGKCKSCTKESVSLYRNNNLEEVKSRVNEYRKNNLEKASEYNRSWREDNKEYKRERDKEYAILNREKRKANSRKYYADNKDRLNKVGKDWRENNKEYKKQKDKEYHDLNKKNRNNRHNERMETDTLYSLSHIIRSLIYKSLNRSGFTKKSKTHEILGCSFEDFVIHLESKFENWMNWDNRGIYNGEINYGWDIDHIIPISSAKTEDDVIRLNHYTNLQPLCSKINRYVKKDKIKKSD